MARFFSLALTVIVTLALLAIPSHQQHYFPNYPGFNSNQRLFFQGQLLPAFLVKTSTSTSTITVSATCTNKVADDCDDGENPFPSGFARSLADGFETEQIIPSNVVNVEPTAAPIKRQVFYHPAGYQYPYGEQLIDSSIFQASGYNPYGSYPMYAGAAQARLFLTRTVTTTTVSTKTRSLNPECNKAGFFTLCA